MRPGPRGPHRPGHRRGPRTRLVCAFDDATGDLIWRQRMPEGGWATGPVLVGDTLYASGTNGDVAAFDAFSGTGTPRWTANVGGPDTSRLTGVTVLGGTVYAGTSDGRVMAVAPPATAGARATVTELATFAGQVNDGLRGRHRRPGGGQGAGVLWAYRPATPQRND